MGIAVLNSKFDGLIHFLNFMELICGKGYPMEIITLETIYKFSHTHVHCLEMHMFC